MSRVILKHHQQTIDNLAGHFKGQADIRAVIVGGSVAHGFATKDSDLDIFLLISEKGYQERFEKGELTYWNDSLTSYDGYVDGKYITVDFLKKVAEKGSEPARFAFKDAFVVFSRMNRLEVLLKSASRYPVEEKEDKIEKFCAQFEAWKWFAEEARKKNNLYLLTRATASFTLFAGRLILTHNEMLYPYHKWFLRVLGQAPDKPEGLLEQIERVLKKKGKADIEDLYNMIGEFADWGFNSSDWPNRFMHDSELTWMDGKIPVDDL
ncbi:MAG TPA: nucleotidyltransferase domain-containing protein [Halanaerobiales bacterium]|nr:nucleotidyltransferase domain-containing protein [Halanaerobiales bacterium]